ncbi:MAG: 23S rRNA (adenine(2503)-C(2))-methyltransferase RlmN [Herpetosiphonaceae bacterium]|nr:23S rRNA (adenine(2503)-C(2))-methyltransferase RlmN [Herpetosiphonaceae bacterium]
MLKQIQQLKPNVYDYTLPELEALLQGWGQPTFRARQLYRQLYVNLAASFEAMTDLPVALRARLAEETRLGSLDLRREQMADSGDTRKALWALPGEAVIETVLMRYPERATVCVSTQAGCAMGCVFCATGQMGLLRNVSTGEIVEQVLHMQRVLRTNGAHLTNLVFMGMGEPFANYDRWWAAVERLHDPQGFNFGARNMTVSTVGLVPGIHRLASETLPVNLAVSLHAPSDQLRSALMPVNQRFPLHELLAAVQEYIERTRRRVSFEYVLLQGQNDTRELAAELADLVGGMLCHVNLIPWNPVPGTPLHRSHRRQVETFQQVLVERGIPCTVRVERGLEIAAACGQLAALPAGMPLVVA